MNKTQPRTHTDPHANTHLSVMSDYRSSKGPMNSECFALQIPVRRVIKPQFIYTSTLTSL